MKTKFDENKIDFEKMGGLIPTIIQEKNGSVLSLFYSNKESLKKSLKTKKVWLFSRSRNKVCQKGELSGNVMKIADVKTDCDNDALLFTVKLSSKNKTLPAACHTGAYSCFGTKRKFDLETLYEKILARKKEPSSKSYTKKLFSDEALLRRKITEEASEVTIAKTKKELEWECADLFYFLLVKMAKDGVSPKKVFANLEMKNNAKEKGMKVGGGVIG